MGTSEATDDAERDSAPLMRRGAVEGMIALEVSSSGEAMGDDVVLDDDEMALATHRELLGVYQLHPRIPTVRRRMRLLVQALRVRVPRALVTYPFLCGSVMFTLGSYLGVFQAINVGRRGASLMWEWVPEKDGFMGYLYYLIGALVFNVSCAEPLEMFAGLPPWMKREMAWGAAEIGSAFFVAGAYQEVRHNRAWDVRACLKAASGRPSPSGSAGTT